MSKDKGMDYILRAKREAEKSKKRRVQIFLNRVLGKKKRRWWWP